MWSRWSGRSGIHPYRAVGRGVGAVMRGTVRRVRAPSKKTVRTQTSTVPDVSAAAGVPGVVGLGEVDAVVVGVRSRRAGHRIRPVPERPARIGLELHVVHLDRGYR